MGPNFLIRELGVAMLGGLGVWAVQAMSPLRDDVKGVLQGAMVLATLATMAHLGGLF